MDSSKVLELVQTLDDYHKRRRIVDFHKIVVEPLKLTDSAELAEDFLKSYGKIIIRLPFSQLVQIWKIFIQSLAPDRLSIIRLFSTFLNHFRIADETTPKVLEDQVATLIEETKKFAQHQEYFSINEQIKLEILLELIYALGNVILLTFSYKLIGKRHLDKERLKYCKDLYPVHDYFEAEGWEKTIERSYSFDSKRISLFAFKLQIQKVNFLLILEKRAKTIKKSKSIRKTVVNLVNQLISIVEEDRKLLLPFVLPFIPLLSENELFRIANLMTRDWEEIETYLKPEMSSIKEIFEEDALFQESICTSIINEAISILPKSPWQSVLKNLAEISVSQSPQLSSNPECVLQSLENYSALSSSLKDLQANCSIDKHLLGRVLKPLHLLPLNHLQPETQIRCSIFLSSILFSLSPEKCYRKILSQVVSFLVLLITGTRHIWLLKFIDSAQYINVLLKRGKYFELLPNHYPKLLSLMIERAFRDNRITLDSLHKINQVFVETSVHPATNLFLASALLAELNKRFVHNQKSESLEKKNEFSEELENQLVDSLFDLVENWDQSFDELTYKAIINLINHQKLSRSNSKSHRKRLKKLIQNWTDQCLTILSMENSKSTVLALRFFLHLTAEPKVVSKVSKHLTPNLMEFFTTKYIEIEDSESGPERNAKRRKLEIDEEDEGEILATPESDIESLLVALSEKLLMSTTYEEFRSFCNRMKELITSGCEETKLLNCLLISEGIFSSDWSSNWSTKSLESDRKRQFMNEEFLDQLISSLITVMLKISNGGSTKSIVCVLDLIQKILHFGKTFMTSPRIYACIQCMLMIPFKELPKVPENFALIFSSFHGLLKELIINYGYSCASCIVLIKDIFYKLFQNLIIVSEQKNFAEYQPKVCQDIVKASADFNKLITLLIQSRANFVKEAPHLLALFLTSSHRVTVHPAVKHHLILTVYRLLNLIKTCENWMETYEMIHCRLNDSSREILKDIFENYEKYYIFKGRF